MTASVTCAALGVGFGTGMSKCQGFSWVKMVLRCSEEELLMGVVVGRVLVPISFHLYRTIGLHLGSRRQAGQSAGPVLKGRQPEESLDVHTDSARLQREQEHLESSGGYRDLINRSGKQSSSCKRMTAAEKEEIASHSPIDKIRERERASRLAISGGV
ncbi:hypothetical protein EYF80_016726 [Liparis tanakae]|uniref:Uncharacterized protein n=1 Tax=Liparis tanakae TaxID=230148 RepID=A0A4Z2I4R3_9TELE|nr:hypothetical protein EYF80_016726 [Liparis tanakae]